MHERAVARRHSAGVGCGGTGGQWGAGDGGGVGEVVWEVNFNTR